MIVSTILSAIVQAAPAPQAFDPVEATNAYLATISSVARARSDAYFEGGYWLILWNALVSVGVAWGLLQAGVVSRLSERATAWTKGRKAGRAFIFACLYLALTGVVTLPWSIYVGWLREHQYGMSNQTLPAWLGEWLIGTAIGTILGGLALLGLLTLYRKLTRSWWAWGTLASGFFLLVGLLLGPVFIEPLFNRYTPMPASPLRAQILQMAQANGVPTSNVLVVDASRQTKRISANVAGVGPTVRVALNDNLLNRTSPPEVRAVMGHELGHYVLGHTASLLIGFTLIAGLFLLVLDHATPWLVGRYGSRWHISGRDDPAMLVPATIVASLLAVLLTPVTNSLIRFHETQADYFGINTSRAPDGWARVALRLGEYRKLEPSRLEEIVFFDHPSGRTRILMSMQWKAHHLGEPDLQ
ncbi:M48 family metalloprotease [Sphingomonas radiodurans]|uniref:M48 family metalloprotease n=1 Tax=Sphingomonas radiodurans TaxID=2890321 RepID=UPI001E3475C7|nr:M48 family metalloprotease [Sphingomonas radiodurans]WBH15034.1 M48 family metalloprotease [Sphingomonas radiodurans]